ncbi:MAG: PLP-dependent aminotransferase family protein [Rhodobacteraceae bacterium]|nr:PLP-dependent aminotransferase family protein [Paracoccaceae bacterium]
MLETFFSTPFDPSRRLQHQIQERLIEAILAGVWPLHEPLPATRVLAQTLKVSRNTIALVYERLTEDGYLQPISRRGYFINERTIREQLNVRQDAKLKDSLPHPARPFNLDEHVDYRYTVQRNIEKPANWVEFEYPFIYGQPQPDKTSVARWRDCLRLAGTAQHAPKWMSDLFDRDDPMLIDQIIRRILPQRGFRADPDSLLITIGAQNAIFLAAQLFVKPGSRVDMEEPGYADARNIFNSMGADIHTHRIDSNGMRVSDDLKGAKLVYVTPGHQAPTNVTMSLERRVSLIAAAETHDFLIMEDNYEHELNFIGAQRPALKSFDRSGRVIHIGSLSKPLFPGLRLGFIAAHPGIIAELRALRRLMYRHPPSQDQRAFALFLAEGHFDTHIRRQRRQLAQKWKVMFRETEIQLPMCDVTPTTGGSGLWLALPHGVSALELARECSKQGVILEAGGIHFSKEEGSDNYVRLGFGAIEVEKIPQGIAIIAKVLTSLMA